MSGSTNYECPLFTDTYIPFPTSFGDDGTKDPSPLQSGGTEAVAVSGKDDQNLSAQSRLRLCNGDGGDIDSGKNNSHIEDKVALESFGSSSHTAKAILAPAFGTTSTPAVGATSASAFDATNPFEYGSSGFTLTNPFENVTQPSQPDLEISIFGASNQPAFGSTEAPAFSFGSTPTLTNPFGSATQPSQPAFETNIFGSSLTRFGASSQPAFGSTEAPAFGATSTPAVGATSASAFDATNPFEYALEYYSHHFERSNTYSTEGLYYLGH